MISRGMPFDSMTGRSFTNTSCWYARLKFKLAIPFQFTSNTTSSLICPTPANWQMTELLSTLFLHTPTGSLPSTVTFPAFSPLIIVFVFLTFTINLFHFNSLFQASSLPFRLSSISLNNDKLSTWSSSSGHPDLISLCSISINQPWCNPTYTRESSVKVPLTLTQHRAFLCIDCTILINHTCD